MIKLSKEHHDYILNIMDVVEVKERIKKCSKLVDKFYECDMDDDLEIDFCDFLQDKQVEIGFDESYNPNNEGEKIQKIIDEVYFQVENE